jgi:SAM-dependent methyltransferase
MEDFLKTITNFDSINTIYQNKLFTLKSISQYLGEWYSLSTEEQWELENQTTADSLLNGNLEEYKNNLKNYDGSEKLAYGEITKTGTENIYKWIKSNVDFPEDVVFYDIGSGHGKMVMHLSLISNFKKIVGIELSELRYKYCLGILNQIGDLENVEFINDDVLNCDISDATVVFMNDALLPQDLIHSIFSKLKPGTIVISIEENKFKPLGKIDVEVSWLPVTLDFNFYIINK